MSYVMKTNLSMKANYGGKRNLSDIKYIVLHYTANDGDHDESNANYFHNNKVGASAHYFVDDDSITQSVPDDYVAWAVGGAKWADCDKTGGGKLYGKVTNANSISIEMCDTYRDGKILATNPTLDNTAEFVKVLMKKYNIDAEHVVRHFDVNGKHCPSYFMSNDAWNFYKKRFVNQPVTKTESPTAAFNPGPTKVNYKVQVTNPALYIRKEPSFTAQTNGYTGKGVFTIVAEQSGFGKLKSGAGWIALAYTKKL